MEGETITDKVKTLVWNCKCSVEISVNYHRDLYETAAERLRYLEEDRGEDLELEPAVRERMIETNTIIEIQFYPNTPVAFYQVYHYDLDRALDIALSVFY